MASLRMPIGVADADGGAPVARVEGRVFRRVSLMPIGTEADAVAAHYRERFEAGGYSMVFECEGVEVCGGGRFVSQVVEDFVTAPGNVSRSRSVITLTRPDGGDLRHFSLKRERGGTREHLAITLARSEQGPLVVVTQQAFSRD